MTTKETLTQLLASYSFLDRSLRSYPRSESDINLVGFDLISPIQRALEKLEAEEAEELARAEALRIKREDEQRLRELIVEEIDRRITRFETLSESVKEAINAQTDKQGGTLQ